ncbi:MAG: hypothetical protein A2X59_09210 [Nitrospirae bacterium GWC2_42_7]|nr:MAG: hypothetical protein A2X59_09210 [Nitrospirae bacterium GWC2_42_7]
MTQYEWFKTNAQATSDVCDRCHDSARVQHCTFYWYVKGEGVYKGNLCKRCMSKVILQSTLWNLVFGIWTVWGLFAGPIFIVINTLKYLKYVYRFKRKAF